MTSIRALLGLPVNTNLRKHRTYRIWSGMCRRVTYERHHAYERYKKLGVTVCARWQGVDGFRNFLLDMGHPPTEKHSLERVNNRGPYRPKNCVWATPAEQNRNKSDTIRVEAFGKTVPLSEAARLHGIAPHLALQRYARGHRGATLFVPSTRNQTR